MRNSLTFPAAVSIRLLDDFPIDEARSFVDSCRVLRFAPGSDVLRQGGSSQGALIILSGIVEIGIISADGAFTILNEVGPGEILGEAEAVAELPILAQCTARNEVIALLRTTQQLMQDINAPLMKRNLARIACHRLERDNALKVADRVQGVEGRICGYLVQLARRDPVITHSQSYLASVVGCSRQTINRTLGLLRDEGLLRLATARIEILDIESLQKRGGGSL